MRPAGGVTRVAGRGTTTPPSLVSDVRRRLLADMSVVSGAAVASALVRGGLQGDSAVLATTRAVQAELTGLGPLSDLAADPTVTDIVVTSPSSVWCDRGAGLQRADVAFADDGAVRRFAQRLAGHAGRRLDEGAPFVDVGLPGGVRLHAVLPPIAGEATQLSLRVPPRTTFTVAELVERATLSADSARLVVGLVAARLTFLITGGTGSGKTTLLSAVLGAAHPSERLLLIEDIPELRPAQPHVVRLQTRPANVEGAGEVTLRDLVRQALRMRPDRLVVGEVRGAEVVELLAAFNTGHAGGAATLHANSPADVPARVEALAAMAALPRHAAHSLLLAAVDAVVHIERRGGARRVTEVAVLRRDGSGLAAIGCAARFDADGSRRAGPAYDDLERLLGAGGRP